MLRDLTIKNYRCFEDFQIDSLERVNLFVGNNNSGKTSLLEAIYLLVSKDKYGSLLEILAARGEIIETTLSKKHPVQYLDNDSSSVLLSRQKLLTHVEPIQHIFYNHKLPPEHYIEIVSDNKDCGVVENLVIGYDDDYLYINVGLNQDENQDKQMFKLSENNTLHLSLYSLMKDKDEYIYLSDKKEKIEQMMLIWDDVYMTDKEKKVVQALQILEPKIEQISFLKHEDRSVARLKIIGNDKPIPISSMGEGIYRILNLSMSLIKAENGVLLIDEIETGLHYEAQTDMWRLILATAKELNVQVFATTHSWDCIAAYQEALAQVEDQSMGKLFRLDSKYGKLRAVEYDAEDLAIAVRKGIEVR
jgi:AAA15 family ATPase/GTPase